MKKKCTKVITIIVNFYYLLSVLLCVLRHIVIVCINEKRTQYKHIYLIENTILTFLSFFLIFICYEMAIKISVGNLKLGNDSLYSNVLLHYFCRNGLLSLAIYLCAILRSGL